MLYLLLWRKLRNRTAGCATSQKHTFLKRSLNFPCMADPFCAPCTHCGCKHQYLALVVFLTNGYNLNVCALTRALHHNPGTSWKILHFFLKVFPGITCVFRLDGKNNMVALLSHLTGSLYNSKTRGSNDESLWLLVGCWLSRKVSGIAIVHMQK